MNVHQSNAALAAKTLEVPESCSVTGTSCQPLTGPMKVSAIVSKEQRVWIKASAIAVPASKKAPKRGRSRATSNNSVLSSMADEVNGLSNSLVTEYEWKRGWMSEQGGSLSLRVDSPSEGESSTATLSKEKLEEDVLMANDDNVYPHDLVTLPYFHEPAVVQCLGRRYEKGLVYTSTGPVLLALNPFKHLPEVYGDDVMEKYWKKTEQGLDEVLPPHVYAIADSSFRSMMRGVEMAIGRKLAAKCDQSILVSGESGAGKTVTTKYLMKYLAALSQRAARHAAGASASRVWTPITASPQAANGSSTPKHRKSGTIEAQVLQSNPILESFGNARTIRNDNSSRFGKYIDMQFSRTGRLLGTKIDTYLLEKVRLVTQNPGERNYHVFYELLSGAIPPEELELFRLDDTTKPQDFKILSSGTFDRRDGVSDRDTYKDLRKAMDMMEFSDEERTNVFAVTAAILHASNLTFDEVGSEESALNKSNKHLKPACELFGVTPEALKDALCYFSIKAQGKTIRRPQILSKAEKGLDALLKAAYGALFTYLVQKVNQSIAFKETPETMGMNVANIGVLDIFGFESFTTNSFEQLCINYCNEALQQQFNTFMLKNEQAEYVNEGIDWDFIKFPENQDVLDLIDHRTSGIMSILDDMCRAPGATDNAFAQQVYKICESKDRFEVSRQASSSFQFSINHYAGPVEYTTTGFVEKNRDDLPRETTELLMNSKNPFVHELAEIITSAGQSSPSTESSKNSLRASAGGHFRRQVKDLRAKIDTTSPHYVRCIKPNELLVSNRFDEAMVAQQLRCGGILQAVSVTRDGFTLHYTHADFVNRYGILARSKKHVSKAATASRLATQSTSQDCKQLVDTMLKKLRALEESRAGAGLSTDARPDPEEKLIEFGRSKVLLKHHAFEELERLLGFVQNRSATRLNTIFRRHLARTAFFAERKSFRKELQELGQTFKVWFEENRALYYRPRQKSGNLEIPNIVSLRTQLYKKNTSESFNSAASGISKIKIDNEAVSSRMRQYGKTASSCESFASTASNLPKKREVDPEKQAWIEINGVWARNPDYKP